MKISPFGEEISDSQKLIKEFKQFVQDYTTKQKYIYTRKERQTKIIKQKNRMSYLSVYGINEEIFNELRFNQDNRCGICREPFKKHPNVDHNHITGEIRGLLCQSCNIALGLLHDDPLRCTRAAEYLLNHPRL